MTVFVPDGECMCFFEVEERLRECVSILPGSVRVFSVVRSALLRRGCSSMSKCLVQEIEIRGLAKDMNASVG